MDFFASIPVLTSMELIHNVFLYEHFEKFILEKTSYSYKYCCKN